MRGVNLKMKQFLRIIGICSAILFIIAGFLLLDIKSVSGDSIAESFYHGVGWMSFGFGLLSGGLLIGLSEKFEDSPEVTNSPIKIEKVENQTLKEWLTK
jgi:hypothetical protein